jgi:hypothetical protein
MMLVLLSQAPGLFEVSFILKTVKSPCYVVVWANRITDYIRHMLRNSSGTPSSGCDTLWVICLSGLGEKRYLCLISRIAAVALNVSINYATR